LTKNRLFLLLATLTVAARFCHVSILWEGDTLPLATAGEMLRGKVLYRDIWFDKPPLLPLFDLLWGAQPGWPLRLGGAIYALLACWIAYRFARDLWSEREGLWAAALLGFFLIFDFPSAVIPVASDLLMLAPHLAAVWMAARKRPLWSGVLAGVAFWINPKGVFVLAACVLWNPSGVLWIAAGFAASTAIAIAGLAFTGSLSAYWDEVWRWGRLYAGSPMLATPFRNGIVRTVNWLGFHASIAIAAAIFFWRGQRRWLYAGWLLLALAGVAAGLRFFPRYYFLLLPVLVIMASRGFTLFGPRREWLALLLLIPATRFGPLYLRSISAAVWGDTAMDRDSRSAATLIRSLARPGDTLFVWGYRPELYVYTGLPAATIYLDSQPLSGVPADRHLTSSEPVETEAAGHRRAELVRARPAFLVDGLGPYNPALAIMQYPEFRAWLASYREVARRGQAVIYHRDPY
jgi:hypothetical protein